MPSAIDNIMAMIGADSKSGDAPRGPKERALIATFGLTQNQMEP